MDYFRHSCLHSLQPNRTHLSSLVSLTKSVGGKKKKANTIVIITRGAKLLRDNRRIFFNSRCCVFEYLLLQINGSSGKFAPNIFSYWVAPTVSASACGGLSSEHMVVNLFCKQVKYCPWLPCFTTLLLILPEREQISTIFRRPKLQPEILDLRQSIKQQTCILKCWLDRFPWTKFIQLNLIYFSPSRHESTWTNKHKNLVKKD